MKKAKVFLGGTCSGSRWRDEMKQHLSAAGLTWFDPVVDDWDEQAQASELRERETCDFCLYAITPMMVGVYSVAEVIDDSNKRPGKTVFVLLREDDMVRFTDIEWKSLMAVAGMVGRNGAASFVRLELAAEYMKHKDVAVYDPEDEGPLN